MGEILFWLFMSIVKFLVTPSLMVAAGYSCISTIIITSVGAFLGVVVFYKLGMRIFNWIAELDLVGGKKKKKKVVTPTRRRLVELKNKYGFAGILLISVVISVPISSIVVAKYFSNKPAAMYVLGGAFFVWSIILTLISWRLNEVLVL